MTKKSVARTFVLAGATALALVGITMGDSVPDVPLVDFPESRRNGEPIMKTCGRQYPRCRDQIGRKNPAGCLFYNPFDSGFVDNPSDEDRVVFEQVLDHQLVREFGVRILPRANRLSLGPGSRVEIVLPGGAAFSDRWLNTGSGWYSFIHGNSGKPVTLRLVAGPRTVGNRVASTWTALAGRNAQEDAYNCGYPPNWHPDVIEMWKKQGRWKKEERSDLPTVDAGICAVDQREEPEDEYPAVARLLNEALEAECTGFLVDCPNNVIDKCMVTAGHCFEQTDPNGEPIMLIAAEFDPLPSSPDCELSIRDFRDPKYFKIDQQSIVHNFQSPNSRGRDWAVFRLELHSETNKTAFEEQGEALAVWPESTPLPDFDPDASGNVRVVGYGTDSGHPVEACDLAFCAGSGERNQVQQTSTGRLEEGIDNSGDSIPNEVAYTIDTCGGSSGSPVIWEETGQVVGIHTNGQCSLPEFGFNSGTAITEPLLRQALGLCSTATGQFTVAQDSNMNGKLPAVDAAEDGSFVVAWSDKGESTNHARAQRFSAAGESTGASVVIPTSLDAFNVPDVASHYDGSFVVAWQELENGNYDIRAARYSSTGQGLGDPFLVNAYTTSNQRLPSVAIDAEGNFVVAWEGFGDSPTNNRGVFGRRFDADGDPIGEEFMISNPTQSYLTVRTETANADDGAFAVMWSTGGAQGRTTGIHAFDSAGELVGVIDVAKDADFATIAMDQQGSVLVAWRDGFQVWAQRFLAFGAPLGDPILVHQGFGSPLTADLLPDQQFAVARGAVVSDGSDADGWSIQSRLFSAAGVPLNPHAQVNLETAGDQTWPAITSQGEDGYIVMWDESETGVQGRRVTPASPTLCCTEPPGDVIFSSGFESGDLRDWS